ncbi:MAG: DJ-1/PfpI family protein [Candidatus Sumerlaeia bacterium]|nr:DJ-1/PfpI family protein [Candidatus Sumerlaeia bacterium]
MLHSLSPFTVLILVFDDVDALACGGPSDIFGSAVDTRGEPYCLVKTVAPRPGTVRCAGGLAIHPDHSLRDAPRADLIIAPGGVGRVREMTDDRLIEWIRARSLETPLMLSIGTGAFLLAAAGALEGREATTDPSAAEELGMRHPRVKVSAGEWLVDAGPVVTSRGGIAGIRACLHVLARVMGADAAERAGRSLCGPESWSDPRA